MENNSSRKWRKVTDFALNASANTNEESDGENEEEVAGDLLFDSNGDFSIGEDTTRQHQSHTIIAAKGELRESPQAGVHLAEFLNTEGLDITEAQAEIELQLEIDGQKIDKVTLALTSEGSIQVDAGWEKE